MDNQRTVEPMLETLLSPDDAVILSDVLNTTISYRNSDVSSRLIKNQTVRNSALMFGAGVLGNFLAGLVLVCSPKFQKKTMFFKLAVALIITDLLGIVTTSPIVIAVYDNNFKWIGGYALCQYFAFMMIFAGLATILLICLMSVERHLCICHPYLYQSRIRPKYAKFFVYFCWTVAIVIASLPLVGVGHNKLMYPNTWCFFDYYSQETSDVVFSYLYSIISLTAILITLFNNIMVIWKLLKLWRNQAFLSSKYGSFRKFSHNKRKKFSEIEMVVQLIGISTVLTVCYAPLLANILLKQTGWIAENIKTDIVLIRFASMNQILDPWIYFLLRRELLQKFFLYLRKRKLIKRKHEENDQTFCIFCWACFCESDMENVRDSFRRRLSMFSVSSDFSNRSNLFSVWRSRSRSAEMPPLTRGPRLSADVQRDVGPSENSVSQLNASTPMV